MKMIKVAANIGDIFYYYNTEYKDVTGYKISRITITSDNSKKYRLTNISKYSRSHQDVSENELISNYYTSLEQAYKAFSKDTGYQQMSIFEN